MRIGKSYAVTIPTKWARANVSPDLPYLTTTEQPDGSLAVRPFTANQPAATNRNDTGRLDRPPRRPKRKATN